MLNKSLEIILVSSLFLLFISEFTTAQSKSNNSPRSYQEELDSVMTAKKENEVSKKNLIDEIAELKKISSGLTEKIRLATLEIEKLYTDKFGKEIGVRIYNKQIWKGMTDKMLLASWGKPDRIDKNVEKWGTFTQWFYGKITFFFRDGNLTDWEELK